MAEILLQVKPSNTLTTTPATQFTFQERSNLSLGQASISCAQVSGYLLLRTSFTLLRTWAPRLPK